MQFYISLLASITAFGATVNAVGLCTGVNPDGTCTLGTCHTQDIGFGVEQETPGINCIFNTVDDPGFNLLICSGPNLSGQCNFLQDQPRTIVTGDFNWPTPNTESIFRDGN